MNKRDFVLGGAALAMSGTAAAGARTQAPARVSLTRLPDLAAAPDPEQWRGYLGENFVIEGGQGAAQLKLAQVAETRREAATRQFTCTFHAEEGAPFQAALSTLRHANGQRVHLYLEPSATDPGVFIAQFNRLS